MLASDLMHDVSLIIFLSYCYISVNNMCFELCKQEYLSLISM